MNDKDKEAFEQWFKENSYDYYGYEKYNQEIGWQAACEYTQKEIDELKDRLRHEVEMIDGAAKDHIEKLQAENTKLKEQIKNIWKEA